MWSGRAVVKDAAQITPKHGDQNDESGRLTRPVAAASHALANTASTQGRAGAAPLLTGMRPFTGGYWHAKSPMSRKAEPPRGGIFVTGSRTSKLPSPSWEHLP